MRRLPLDQARLRPHLREREQADIFRREFDRAGRADIDTTAPRARRNDGVMVDPLDLRGLPAIARGVAGATPGSNPLSALLAKERRRQ